MSIFASVDPATLNTDPLPYVVTRNGRVSREMVPSITQDTRRYAPRPEYTPATIHPANVILLAARENWDKGDPFGSAMAWMFATLQHWQEWQDARIGTVPPEYGFRDNGGHGEVDPENGDDYEYWQIDQALARFLLTTQELASGAIITTQDMIVHAAAVFDRIINQARLNGRDY